MGPPDGVASLCARWPKPASSVTAAGRCCGVETLMAERSASSFAGICSGRSCAEGSCWRSSRTRCAYCSSISCMRLSSSRIRVRIGQDSVPRLGRGCKPMDQARKHGGPGLPEDVCVCAAAAMSRLSPPASPERARCIGWLAKHESPTPQG
eukprot:scaffold10078_cov47-Phaeocystis_antarctica.AAC.1